MSCDGIFNLYADGDGDDGGGDSDDVGGGSAGDSDGLKSEWNYATEQKLQFSSETLQ